MEFIDVCAIASAYGERLTVAASVGPLTWGDNAQISPSRMPPAVGQATFGFMDDAA